MAITKVKVFRYNPDTDLMPHYQTYDVEMDESLTVLFILKEIYDKYDPTLAYRHNLCMKGVCTQCLVTVNGKVVKACSTLIQPGQSFTVEPVFANPVVRDLVTDMGTIKDTEDGTFVKKQGVLFRKVDKDKE
jgi:succinate dehydrogenase / fumarate reductase iron-sulfur subunit